MVIAPILPGPSRTVPEVGGPSLFVGRGSTTGNLPGASNDKLTCETHPYKVTWDRWSGRSSPRPPTATGVDDETILHAFNHPIRVEDLDEGMTMLVGPDHAGNLYEIGVASSSDGPVVVHAMPARSKYLR